MDQAAHAAEAGADAVVIHHPHVPSPIVLHPTKDGRTVPIFASVGNLVTNQGESWKPPMFPVMPDNRRLVCVNGWTRLGVLADLAFKFDKGTTTLEWHSHLVWVDNEHADDRNVMVPHITARLLDPEKDRGIVERLSDDRRGPIGLFDDPCWSERAGASLSNRCTLSRPSAPSLTSHPGRAARRKK
jgi:poly-gamma-glutamate synthesis protein (capsule biosynthesis protein)